MSKIEALREAKGLLAAIISTATVCILIGGALAEWRIGVAVTKALAAQDIATDDKIISMDDEIDANSAVGEANTTRIDGNERRVELAFAALMGRKIPEREDE